MNNKTIIWVVVGVVVVVGLVWFFMGRSGSPSAANNQVQGSATQAGSAAPISLKGLFSSGQSQKCTFTNTSTDGTQANGTVYVASGHMRGDFTAQTSAGQTMTSHMITDGTTSWVWTDASGQMAAQGMKMSFAGMGQTQAGTAGQQSPAQSVDPNQQMNYSCSGWSPDQSEFTLPTNINFMDMSAMMQGAAGAGAGASAGAGAKAGASGNSAICSACNQITNATQKAQCLSALGCK